MLAGDVLKQMSQELDDPGLVHHQESALTALSEAQRLVSWRFSIIKATAPLLLIPRLPLHKVQLANSRSIWVLHASYQGTTLWPVSTNSLRLKDPAWAATVGMPEYFYRFGLTRVGFYPVPDVEISVDLTMLVAPISVVDANQTLEVPDSYQARITDVAVGLLLITGERAFQQGIARMRGGLDLPTRPRLTERQAREKQS